MHNKCTYRYAMAFLTSSCLLFAQTQNPSRSYSFKLGDARAVLIVDNLDPSDEGRKLKNGTFTLVISVRKFNQDGSTTSMPAVKYDDVKLTMVDTAGQAIVIRKQFGAPDSYDAVNMRSYNFNGKYEMDLERSQRPARFYVTWGAAKGDVSLK